MFTRVLRSADAADGGSAKATELPIRGEDGMTTDLRLRHRAWMDSGPLSDSHVRGILADCTNFLRQLVRITSDVVETVGVGQVRQIVAAELPLSRQIIREDGTCSDKPTPAVEAPDRDHRKHPRGRKHPLITLVQMALQGVRLLMQITQGTNPGAHNEETLTDQHEREAAREAERREREALKEQERTLSKLLSGRM
jgi:hypothetical protein